MSALLYGVVQILPQTAVNVVPNGSVRVGHIGNDLLIHGSADDLDRLANALHEAAASIRETA